MLTRLRPQLKVAAAPSCPAHCPAQLAPCLPPAGSPTPPQAPPPPGHASQVPLGSRRGEAKLGRPRRAPGPRAHTKLGCPRRGALLGAQKRGRKEGRVGRGAERGRGPRGGRAGPGPGCSAAASAAPGSRPFGAERAEPGPFLPQSAALAGNNAARLPRSRQARPTGEHPRSGLPPPPAGCQRWRRLPGRGMPNRGEREEGAEEGAERRRGRSGSCGSRAAPPA